MDRFCCKAKIMEGNEALERVGFEIYRTNASRILVITDRQSVMSGARSRLKKLAYFYDARVNYLNISVKSWATTDNVKIAYDKFIKTKSDFIICMGSDVVADIGKAVKLLVNVGVSKIEDAQNLNVEDKVPLMLIPTSVNSIAYGVGEITVYDEWKRKIYRLIGESASPNHIIIDNQLIDKLTESEINKRVLRVVGIALIALSDRELATSSRVFSYAALDIVKSLFLSDSSKQSKEANVKVIAGIVDAGIGYKGMPNRIFKLMVMYIAIRKKLDHLDAFMILLDSFLKVFGESFDPEDINMLGVYLEDDHVFQIKDDSERGQYVIGEFRKLINHQYKESSTIYNLRDIGLVKEDLEIIIAQIIVDLGDKATEIQQLKIRNLMYSAY